MTRISSNSTMFLKFFIPIMWCVFFGAMMIAMFSHKGMYNAVRSVGSSTPYILLFLYLLVVLGLYLTVWRLKRVECDEYFVYVTDYFKTTRYPYHQIDKINETSFFSVPVVDLKLKTKGHFGQKLFFLGRSSTLNMLYNNHENISK